VYLTIFIITLAKTMK